jgi:hypothetical protein
MSVRRLRLNLLILFSLCFLALAYWGFSSYRALPDQRLTGAWRVDADATLRDWATRTPVSETRARFWRDTYGQMVVTYYTDRYVTQFRGGGERQFFKTRSRSQEQVVIREVVGGKKVDTVIHFEGPDRLWVNFAPGDERRKYFNRVNPTVQPEPQPARSVAPGLAAIGAQ